MIRRSSVAEGTRLLRPAIYSFSAKYPIESIRNANLRFETDDYHMNMYPFYPQVFKKKQKNVYEVSNTSTVLALMFLKKSLDYGQAWQERRTVTFRFKDIGKLLSAEIGSGRQVKIQTHTSKQNQQRVKSFMVKDLKQEQKMHLKLTNSVASSQLSDLFEVKQEKHQHQIDTKIQYSEYLIIYKILENSLLDLSGWKFMMEIQKRQQINKLDNKVIDDKEIADLLKN